MRVREQTENFQFDWAYLITFNDNVGMEALASMINAVCNKHASSFAVELNRKRANSQ